MRWIDTLNTTNYRILVSTWLLVVYVVAVLVLVYLGRAVPFEIAALLAGTIIAALGLDVQQFRVKRNTQIVTPPQVMATDAAVPSAVAVAPPAQTPEAP